MIIRKMLAAGMVGCALTVVGGSGSFAAGDQPQGAFDGIDTKLRSGQQSPAITISREVPPESLQQEADSLAAAVAAIRGKPFGTAKEKSKLAELANVVTQLRENIAVALPQGNPDEIAFLTDELLSIEGQFATVGFGILNRETTGLTAAVKSLQDEGRSGPEVELVKLAAVAAATAQFKLDVINASSQGDTKRIVALYSTLESLQAQLAGLRNSLYAPLARYTNPMRGTASTGGFARGNTFPATAVPFGFNMWSPVNRNDNSFYEFYSDEDATRPIDTIQAFTVTHQPSRWIGNRQTLQIMPVNKTDANGSPIGNKDQRAEKFKRENETSNAHYYSLKFDNGTRTEISPTDHAAYFRFTVPAGQETLNVMFDVFTGGTAISYDPAAGTVSGRTNHNTNGSTTMFFYAEFDTAIKQVIGNGFPSSARFDTKTSKVVSMRIATSFISIDQAKDNLVQEIGTKTFDQVKKLAQAAWDERLNIIKVDGATEDQKVTLYSNLYRSFLYPNSGWENVRGTPKYMSPYTTTNPLKQGKIWVNNGFWDTYRTTWPLYTLLIPREAGEMLDGFVNAYKDGGWMPRWSGPGYADSMVATSLDVVVADAYLKGVRNFDVDSAYKAILRDATAPGGGGVGRHGMEEWPFYGYRPGDSEGVAWAMEGYLNDFGGSQLAKALGKTDDAAYLANNAISYPKIFDGTSTGIWAGGWFRVMDRSGNVNNVNTLDGSKCAGMTPQTWRCGYTEGNAWSYAFLVPQDGQGLANLYGGREQLKAKLDKFFTTPPVLLPGGYGGIIHEMNEARKAHEWANVGEYQHGNQPTHHSIYMYNFAGYPAGGQKVLRDVMDKLYFSGFDANGKSNGWGYIGDEDNGEQGAWYVLSAMGIYPVSMGRPEYAIGAPYFPKMTVTLKDAAGNPHELVIKAPGVSATNRYVQSVKLKKSGEQVAVPITRSYLRHDELANGGELEFEMGPAASTWGTGPDDVPSSITTGSERPKPLVSLVPRGGYQLSASSGAVAALSNRNSSGSAWTHPAGTPAWIQADKLESELLDRVNIYTLTSASKDQAPVSWVLKGSKDGTNWVTLDQRSNQTFDWDRQVRPFALSAPADYASFRLEFTGAGAVSASEFELLGAADVAPNPSSGPARPVITTPLSVLSGLGEISIAGTGVAASTVRVTEAGTTRCETTVDTSGNWTCSLVLSNGPHTLVAVQVAPDGGVSRPSAQVSITVGNPLRADDDDASIRYVGSWTDSNNRPADHLDYELDVHHTNTPGDYAEFTFYGSAFKLYGELVKDQNDFSIIIDGGAPVTVSQYKPTDPREGNVVIYSKAGLTPGYHTVRMTKLTTGGVIVNGTMTIDGYEVGG